MAVDENGYIYFGGAADNAANFTGQMLGEMIFPTRVIMLLNLIKMVTGYGYVVSVVPKEDQQMLQVTFIQTFLLL